MIYSIPSCLCICSSGTPFVSGTIVFTHTSCKTIMPVKNEKTYAGWKRRHHPGEKSREQRGEDPMGEAAQGLTFGAVAIGKYFGDEDPDHRSLADGVGGDEGENAHGHD